ncbi:MAG: hypothetical protein HDS15_04715 [Bacteroides sp.]|nr:hypothetical protein [Bacteroides sp.]
MKLRKSTSCLSFGLALGVIATGITGCGGNGGAGGSPVTVIDLGANLGAENTEDISEVFEIADVLCPAVTDSTMLRWPEVGGYDGKNLYLHAEEVMMVFDMSNGDCLYSFNKKGNGPGEYIAPWTAWRTPGSDGWTIRDYRTHRIMSYTADGTFLGAFENDTISELMPNGDGWIATNTVGVNKEIVFYLYDQSWQLKDSINSGLTFYMVDDGQVYLPMDISVSDDRSFMRDRDTIYSVVDSKLVPEVAISAPNMTKRVSTFEEEREQRKSRLYIYRAVVNPSYVMVGFTNDGKDYVQIYSRPDGKLVYSRRSDNENPGLPVTINGKETYGVPVSVAYDSGFFVFVTAERMGELTGDEDSNPAIVRIRMK